MRGGRVPYVPTQQDYETARAIALDALARLDIETCCARAGLALEPASHGARLATIPYLGDTYAVVLDRGTVSFDNAAGSLKLPDQVVLLHYLITATGEAVSDDWITFREIPSGHFYYASFARRAIAPLEKCFGPEPELLSRVSEVFGEAMSSPGDKAIKVLALPRVPVVLSLWEGDDEFPPQANLYFDRSIASYLDTEDIAYLAGATVYKAIGVAKRLMRT